jgi:hypothetical protein
MKAPQSTLVQLCRRDYDGEANLLFPALHQAMRTLSGTARESAKIEVVHRNGDKSYVWVSQESLEQSIAREMISQDLDVGLGVLHVHTSGPLKARLVELQRIAKDIERRRASKQRIKWLLILILNLGTLAAILATLHLSH